MPKTITTCVLDGFVDSRLSPEIWNRILETGATNEVFLSWGYQNAWWECFGRGRLVLTATLEAGSIVGIAPLFADSGMLYFVGSGGSDYLDFIGRIPDPEEMAQLLEIASASVPGFLGAVFYHVPEYAPTSRSLAGAAKLLNWEMYEEGEAEAVQLSSDSILPCTRKKSLVRHANWFKRQGGISVSVHSGYRDIAPHLPAFFLQHTRRWQNTATPSLFQDASQRRFYDRLVQWGSEEGWLRFTRILWRERTIAQHLGFFYRGSYLWYKPSFDIALARHSPGEVLLQALLQEAHNEGAGRFDFGLGDEPFKERFVSFRTKVRNWGLYPKGGKGRAV